MSNIYHGTKDDISLPSERILSLINQNRPLTLYQLYEAFRHEDQFKVSIIFVNHGVFNDTSTPERNFSHDGSAEAIGVSGSNERPDRPVRHSLSLPYLPGSYITVDRSGTYEIDFNFSQNYTFYDYKITTEMKSDEPIYFEMPPYPSKATFSYLQDEKITNVTVIDSRDYWDYILSTPEQNAIFAEDSSNENSLPKSQCLIATATFGSELSPQVQFLRDFRDKRILSTMSGSSFMDVFNAWYYSFSPYIANYERQQPWLQQTLRVGIHPLLGILSLSELAYLEENKELGAVSAGFVASALIGAVYFSPITLASKRIRSSRFNYKLAVVILAVTTIAMFTSMAMPNTTILMVTTSLFILSVLAVCASLTGASIARISRWSSKLPD
jgi:hypothetical protein